MTFLGAQKGLWGGRRGSVFLIFEKKGLNIFKNLLASLAHSHRALRAPTYMNFALRAQSCALHSA